jgi:hypothetical protein
MFKTCLSSSSPLLDMPRIYSEVPVACIDKYELWISIVSHFRVIGN